MIDSYDSPWMDEELHIMRDAVAKFLQKEFVPKMSKWEKQGFVDRDAWLIAGKAGLLCASIPEEYGGGGGNFKHEMVLVEELSYANVTGFNDNSCHINHTIIAHITNAFFTYFHKTRCCINKAIGFPSTTFQRCRNRKWLNR